MGELLSEFGDLMFSLVIGYIGAIEFLYVVRHLFHYSFNHDGPENDNDADSLSRLQENMRQQLTNAKSKEAAGGPQVMKDGVQYKDGFRIDPQQAEIDRLKELLKDQSIKDLQRQELEKELAKLQKVAEETRKQLEKAEADKLREEQENVRKLKEAEEKKEREQRKREEEQEENKRKLIEAEKQRELEQRKKEEAEAKRIQEEEQAKKEQEENIRKLQEAEKQKELEQRKREEEEQRIQEEEQENIRKLKEAEQQKEQEQRQKEEQEQQLIEAEKQREAIENERRLLELEREKEEQQRLQEEEDEENERKYLEIEHKLEEQLRAAEQEEDLTEKEQQLIASIKQREFAHDEHNEEKEAELLRRILAAREQLGEESEEEQSLRLLQREQDQERKQKRIEENALLFLEAEKEMAQIQSQLQEGVEKRIFSSGLDSAPQTPIYEEPCIKKSVSPLLETDSAPALSQRVKTQLAQDTHDSYSVTTKPLLFPGVSDEGSSVEPTSSQKSSFSTQPSEEITTGTDSQYPPQLERQEPDGEDTTPSQQYSEDYLRSLDGIKQRPLIREDGSGRRRAFKKRRSSNSSNSSRESRTSRDEELKMFTSLEEEEMKSTGDNEFTPIRYTSEPTLKVKGHHRRHKRSPAKDMKTSDESLRSSLERLGEEDPSNPWGEVQPEHYKNTEFWKREKAVSIDEEIELERPASSEEISYDTATNMPSASSFEEATQIQNEQALTALRKKAASNEDGKEEDADDDKATRGDDTARSDNKTNLQTSERTEKEASPARSSASPRLRRSPRIEEIDQYEERWKENNETTTASTTSPPPTSSVNTPTITVQTPLDFAPWRDQYGLMMEGLSDFYDFTASVNPSRSRSTSRNPSPANTAPNTPLPKDVAFEMDATNKQSAPANTIEIYDDTEDVQTNEFKKENIIKFIDTLHNEEEEEAEEEKKEESAAPGEVEYELSMELTENALQHEIQYVMDDLTRSSAGSHNISSLIPMVNIIDDTTTTNNDVDTPDDMNSLIATLRTQQSDRSRSRSKSPLPTPLNLQRSLENRRNKMIRHNDDVLEKLIETNLLPESPPTPEELEDNSKETMNLLLDTLRAQRSISHSSRSRSRSPLPTAENIERSIEHRRQKRIQANDELLEKLSSPERSQSQSPVIVSPPERQRSQSPVIVNEFFVETSEVSSFKLEANMGNDLLEEENIDDYNSRQKMDSLVQSLRVNQNRSRSKSPMRLPSADNLGKSIDARRHKLIERNDELQQQFDERSNTPDSPQIQVEYVYEYERNTEITEITQQNSQSSIILQAPPTISIEFDDTVQESNPQETQDNDDDCSKEQMDLLVQSLRVARSRSRTPSHRRSKSPMRLPSADNLNKSIDTRRIKLIERNDELQQEVDKRSSTPESPQLKVEYVYEYEQSTQTSQIPSIFIENEEMEQKSSRRDEEEDRDDCSRAKMDSLVQSLRVARSRSHSRSPMPMAERAKTPDPESLSRGHDNETETSQDADSEILSRQPRSKSPSRSPLQSELESRQARSQSPSLSPKRYDDYEQEASSDLRFRQSRSQSPSLSPLQSLQSTSKSPSHSSKTNEEAASSRTPSSRSLSTSEDLEYNEQEALESLKFERHRKIDEEALETLKTASEELELRTLSPLDHDELNEQQSKDLLADLPITERSKLLRKSPTTPEYERTISEEMLDVERIKQDMLAKGFKRSTYVGESLDMGSEYEPLRREAAHFQRSRSPSPTYSRTDIEVAQLQAEEKRKLQDIILAELTGSSSAESKPNKNTGAIPKAEKFKEEMSATDFQRSTFDEEMRRRNADFRRSASKSRSPLQEQQLQELVDIEKEALKRELQDQVLDEISCNNVNFVELSRHLNPNFDIDRRASDSVLMLQKPEMLVQLQDNNFEMNMEMEPEEYHHYRRFSLAQEQPTEEYPSDDYIYIQEVEVRTRSDSTTWVREDFYSEEVDEFLANPKDRETTQSSPELRRNNEEGSEELEEEEQGIKWNTEENSFEVEEPKASLSEVEEEEPTESLSKNKESSVEMKETKKSFWDMEEQQPGIEELKDSLIGMEEDEPEIVSYTEESSLVIDESKQTLSDMEDEKEDQDYEPDQEPSNSENEEEIEGNLDVFGDNENENESEDNLDVDGYGDNEPLEDDEDYSNNSEDDRQTVVEVDDEIDEDISDFKAEESHHDTSECEEADREIDRYAGRRASDWNDVAPTPANNIEEENEGAVGGANQSPYDSDSFAIDQIYDEAVKNRKQSGILREYDSILMQMSTGEVDDQYALWSKTQGKKKPKNVEFNVNFLESERKDTEMRYLGDAKQTERQSIRLRSRYGYNPVLQTNHIEDDVEVDLNYKPKREYNWRKNFKIDEDDSKVLKLRYKDEAELRESQIDEEEQDQSQEVVWGEDSMVEAIESNIIDIRKFSLGGESITLFTRSPERSLIEEDLADNADNDENISNLPVNNDANLNIDLPEEQLEKPKKKKTKKKSRKESKGSLELTNPDEEDIADTYAYNRRRSSSIHMDTDSPKRKSRSRRSSKSSVTNDDPLTLFSPRSSLGYIEPIADIMEEYTEMSQETVVRPKKIKKRKKVKESTMVDVNEESSKLTKEDEEEPAVNMQAISTVITPESSRVNILANLSPQNSVCVTPASIDLDAIDNLEAGKDSGANSNSSPTSTTTTSSRTSSIAVPTTPVDTFDILKDANFYPLF